MSVKIAVLGGCHVDGFPLGGERSFPVALKRSLGRSGFVVREQTLSLVRFRDLTKASDALESSRPDVLILQMGNFEAAPSMRRRGKSSAGSSTVPQSVMDPAAPYTSSVRSVLRDVARLGVHLALGRGAFDREVLVTQVSAFFDLIARVHVPRTIVLTPFPSMDSVIRRQRRRLGALTGDVSAARGFELLDTFEFLDDRMVFLPDGHHLNELGHTRLADALERTLLPWLRETRLAAEDEQRSPAVRAS